MLLRFFFLSFGICLSFIVASGPALVYSAGKDDSMVALKLAEEGWALIRPKQIEFMEVEVDFATPWYYRVCDAPEVANDLFRRAVDLDPTLAKAWLGLGQTTEQLGSCSWSGPNTWLGEEFGLTNRRKIGPGFPRPETDSMITAYGEAEKMFRKAAAAAPDEGRVWSALGSNLLNQARNEKDAERRQDLVNQANECYDRALQLDPEAMEVWGGWGFELLMMLPIENDPATWKKYLADGREKCLKTIEVAIRADSSEGKQSEFAAHPNKGRLTGAFLMFSHQADLPREKVRALREAALENQLEYIKNFAADSEDELQTLGLVYLGLAAVVDEEDVWREYLKQARNHCEQSLKLFRADRLRLPDYGKDMWLDIAKATEDDEKRTAMVMEALSIFESNGEKASGLLGLRFDPDFNLRGSSDALPPWYTAIIKMQMASILPSGQKKNGLIDRAEAELTALQNKSENKARVKLLGKWGQTLFLLAASESEPEKYEQLLEKADAQYRKTEELTPDPAGLWGDRVGALTTASEETNDAKRKRAFLESAVEYQEKLQQARPEKYIKRQLGRLYMQLASVSTESKDPLHGKALKAYVEAAETEEFRMGHSGFSISFNDDKFFTPAQILTSISRETRARRMAWDFDRQYLHQAMGLYRKEFALYPAQSERLDRIGYPEAWTGAQTRAEKKTPETFQYNVTKKLAEQMVKINRAADPSTMDAWDLTQLAGLYRHLALSGMLTREYRSLYLNRAEKMLRRAVQLKQKTAEAYAAGKKSPPKRATMLDSMIYDLSPGQSQPESFGVKEGDLHDLTAAMSELGLVLSEQALPEIDPKDQRLNEAEELWERAEKMRPGSSGYSRARWSAHLNDVEGLKKNLIHTRNDYKALLFPSLEEALADPALTKYVNELWFEKCWYGFDNTP